MSAIKGTSDYNGMRAQTSFLEVSSLSNPFFTAWRATALPTKPKQPSRPPGAIETQLPQDFKRTRNRNFIFKNVKTPKG